MKTGFHLLDFKDEEIRVVLVAKGAGMMAEHRLEKKLM